MSKTLDDIINKYAFGSEHYDIPCPKCEGGGFIAALYPSGHTEVTCDECYGEGYFLECDLPKGVIR